MNFKNQLAIDLIWLGIFILTFSADVAHFNDDFSTLARRVLPLLLLVSPIVLIPKIQEMRHKKIAWLDILIFTSIIFFFSVFFPVALLLIGYGIVN